MALSPGVRAQLGSVTPNGTVSALPLHREDPRTTAQPRADSTWRESISKWIHSEEGRQWAKVQASHYEGATDGLEPVEFRALGSHAQRVMLGSPDQRVMLGSYAQSVW